MQIPREIGDCRNTWPLFQDLMSLANNPLVEVDVEILQRRCA
jgi:hypothetical protein